MTDFNASTMLRTGKADEARHIQNRGTGIALVAFMVVGLPLSCFALAAVYPDEHAFVSSYALLTSVLGDMGQIGAAGGFAVFAGAFIALLMGALAWVRSDRRTRIWSAVTGAILALTLTFRQFSAIHEQRPQNDTNVYPPAIGEEFRTHWYTLYQLTRYMGYFVVLTCVAVALFDWVLRHARARGACITAITAFEESQSSNSAHTNINDDAIAQAQAQIQAVPASPLRVFGNALTAATQWLRPIITDFHVRGIALTAAIIGVCWLPWALLMWPANIGPDTVAQLVWWRTGHAWDPSTRQMLPAPYTLSDHHPWFDTVLYGLFDNIGQATGVEWLGLYLLAVLQAGLTAVALAVLLTYLCGVLGLSWRIGVAGLALYALTPIFGRSIVVVIKESTNMPWFILFCVLLIEYIRRATGAGAGADVVADDAASSRADGGSADAEKGAHGKAAKAQSARPRIGWQLVAGLLATALLCALTRKISVYIVLGALLVTLIFVRRRLVTAAVIAVLMALNMVIPAIMLPALHAAPAGKQEMLSVTLQQSAYNIIHNGDTMSEADRKAVTDVFSCSVDELRQRMILRNADATKDCFNREATSAQIATYLTVWAKEGVEHPVTYLKAVPFLAGPFLMGATYDEGFFVHWGWEDKGGDQILSRWAIKEQSRPQKIAAPLYIAASKAPGLSLLMSENLYVVWIPMFAIALCAIRRRWRNLLYASPVFISIAGLLVQMSHSLRYTWSLAFVAMICVALPFVGEDGVARRRVPQPRD